MLKNPNLLIEKSSKWKYPAKVIADRLKVSILNNIGIYLMVTLALIGGSIGLNNSIRFVTKNIVLVGANPLFLPILIMVIFLSLYLALNASLQLSKEYDRGTYEVLLYGPMNSKAFLLGIFLAFMSIYFFIVLIFMIWANLSIFVTHLLFSYDFLLILLASIVTVGSMISYGLFIASLGGKTRTTIIYFVLFIIIILGIQLSNQFIASLALVTTATSVDRIAVIRQVLELLNYITTYISPLSLLQMMMDDITNTNIGLFFIHLLITLIQMYLLLIFSHLILKKKGAR